MSKILIVEDELPQAEFLQLLLGSHHELIFAETATQGLAAFQQNLPDLLLVDLRLPDFSGFGLLQKLKGTNIPAIVLTSFWNEINAATAMKLGCFAGIDKRDAARDLIPAIEEALSGRPKVSYSFDPEPTLAEFVDRLTQAEKDALRNILGIPEQSPKRHLKKVRLQLLPESKQEKKIQALFQFYREIIVWLKENAGTEFDTKDKLHKKYYIDLSEHYDAIHSQHFNRVFSYFSRLQKQKKKDCKPESWEVLGKFALCDRRLATFVPKDKTVSLSLPPRTEGRVRVPFTTPNGALAALPKVPEIIAPLFQDESGYWMLVTLKPSGLNGDLEEFQDEE